MINCLEQLYCTFKSSTGVSTDTRSIEKGRIFFALKGPNFNGNLYADLALEKGAIAVVLDEKQEGIQGNNVFYVDDVLRTLQMLSAHHRMQLGTHVIGLTGSNGKTTTKELLYTILKKHCDDTFCTQGNLNNHIGVPLSLLSVPQSARYAIIEMGSNQPGDIKELCNISEPDYGLITNIGKTHLEKLKSQKGVFEEKSSLYKKIKERNGQFFLNEGDPFLLKLREDKDLTYSLNQVGPYQITTEKDSLALTFSIVGESKEYVVQTKMFGAFNIENIAAALSIALYFEVPIEICLAAIEGYTPSNMRSQIVKTERNTVLLDAYNSNPFSLKESLNHFVKAKTAKKIAIIGDMKELGHIELDEHKYIIDLTRKLKGITFYFVGNVFYSLKKGNKRFFETVEELCDYFDSKKPLDSNILIKGSRSIALEKVMKHL